MEPCVYVVSVAAVCVDSIVDGDSLVLLLYVLLNSDFVVVIELSVIFFWYSESVLKLLCKPFIISSPFSTIPFSFRIVFWFSPWFVPVILLIDFQSSFGSFACCAFPIGFVQLLLFSFFFRIPV